MAQAPTPARPSRRERARAFVYEGQGDHERFGIFDPAVRWTYAVGTVVGAGLLGATIAEVMGAGLGPAVAALAVAGAVIIAGIWGYRKIWVPPAERELLLQMAKEDDESRAMAARMASKQREE